MSEAQKKDNNTEETIPFATDVFRLLDIVANALYSNKDVFLRELISNASDACDRLRYEAVQNPDLTKNSAPFNILITADNNDTTLTLTDNGIGMNKDELVKNLGTIAHSGTAALMESMKEHGNDMSLIGQFGVGFYASFMVSNKVEVVSSKAGEKEIWHWESDGKSGFNVREASKDEQKLLPDGHGTAIRLHVKGDSYEYLLDDKIKQIVMEYSDHVEVPIYLKTGNTTEEDEKKPINTASALWTRPKSEISKEQYTEFYHHLGHVFDDPTLTLHWKAEGKIEYTALLFVPSLRPWDLYDPERKSAVRLYVKRVFITDQMETLLYPWLRFVRGIVDSQDLPLNISREMLQTNPVVHKIRSGVTKKILSEIDKLSRDDEEAFLALWHQFGMVIKEGLYDAFEHRDDIFKVCRFFTTHDAVKPTSLEDYVSRMKDGQDKIYYISGEKAEALRNSPQLEGFKARGIEVLLMTDTVDEFWLQQVNKYKDFKFQSVTKGQVDLSQFDNTKEPEEKEKSKEDEKEKLRKDKVALEPLINLLHEQLTGQISFARISQRLTESPVCLVADEQGVDMHMEKVLKIQQKYEPGVKKILEINPDHPLIQKLGEMAKENDKKDNNRQTLEDAAHMLMDQALIIQGETLNDPAAFARRMASFMEKGLL
jgi:molecular chaperone HtpG